MSYELRVSEGSFEVLRSRGKHLRVHSFNFIEQTFSLIGSGHSYLDDLRLFFPPAFLRILLSCSHAY